MCCGLLQQLTLVAIRSGHKGRDGRYYVVDFGRYITFSPLFLTSYLADDLFLHMCYRCFPPETPDKRYVHTHVALIHFVGLLIVGPLDRDPDYARSVFFKQLR